MSSQTSTLNGYLLWRAANLWQKEMRGVLTPFGITPVQYLLLSGLCELASGDGRPVKQAALARHSNCDPMMTSQVLRALEKDDLVRRSAHEDDGRAMAVIATEKGQQLVSTLDGPIQEADAAFHSKLGVQSDEFGDALQLISGQRPKRRVKATSQTTGNT